MNDKFQAQNKKNYFINLIRMNENSYIIMIMTKLQRKID